MTQPSLYDAKNQYIGPSEATQQARIEYINAGDDLFQTKIISGRPLCVQGRAYRALRLAGDAPADQVDAYRKAVAELFQTVQKKVDEYTRLGKLYIALCEFGGVQPEIYTWPDCQCEGCQMIRADEDYQERLFEYATKSEDRRQPAGNSQRAA